MSEVESPSVVSCWNTIGVWGSQAPRCEKLQEVVHCHNCEVYWDAGRKVFEKNIPEGYLEQWSNILASKLVPPAKTSQSIIYFRLADEWFAFSTRNFVEVSQRKAIHTIPHQTGDLILGVVSIGGAIRLCFSLRFLLRVANTAEKLPPVNNAVYKRFLVVRVHDDDFVFPVDEVGGVYRYDPRDMKQIPVSVDSNTASLLNGVLDIEGRDVACIDTDKLAQVLEGMTGGK